MGKPTGFMAVTDSEIRASLGAAVAPPHHPNAAVNPSEKVGVGGGIGYHPFPLQGVGGGWSLSPPTPKASVSPEYRKGAGLAPLWPGRDLCVILLVTL